MLLRLTTILLVFLVWVPVAQAWSWPVQGPVLQPFSYDEAHPYDAGQHRGIDIGATATGDPVVAPEGGTVSFAGFVPASGESVTIETADGYSVTLTHLGSIAVAEGASVAEGDVVATVGPSGTPEQSVPYLHLGVRLTVDPLGYLDPLGFLPTPEPPTPTPTPTPAPQPVPQPVPVPAPEPASGGGLVIVQPPVAPPAEAVPAGPPHVRKPTPQPTAKPQAKPAPAAGALPADAPRLGWPVLEPVALPAVTAAKLVHGVEPQPLVLSIAPGIVAALLALLTAFTPSRRTAPVPAQVITLRKEQPLRHAA